MRVAWLGLLSLSACVETAALHLPEGTAGQTIIYVVATGDEPELIWAAEGTRGLPVSLREDQDLYALVYESTLAELALVPGKIDPVEVEPARRLPERGSISVARGGSDSRHFEALAEKNEVLDAILIPGFAPEACERARGCFLFDQGVARCEVPCLRPTAPTEPTPPAKPILTPCPSWWTEVELNVGSASAPRICEPPQDPRPVLGPPCAADGWPVLEDNENVVWVRPGPLPGNGTKESPFSSIGSALNGAPDGRVIGLSIGEHLGNLLTERRARIVGACAGGTSILGTMQVNRIGDLTLEQLEVTRAANDGGKLRLRNVIIRGGQLIVDNSGTLYAEDLAVDGADSQDAIRVTNTSSATLMRVAVIEVQGSGVGVRNNSSATIEDLAIRFTHNIALVVDAGSRLELARASVRHAPGFGVHVYRSSADLRDVVIRETIPHPNNEHAGEAMVFDGAVATLRRAWIQDVYGAGIAAAAWNPGTETDLTVEDATVRTVAYRGGRAMGIEARHQSAFRVSRARLEDVEGYSIWVDTASVTAVHRLEDIRIESSGHPGMEMLGGNFSLQRAAIENAGGAAINVWACESNIEGSIEDLSVRSLISRPNDIFCGDDMPAGTGIGIALRGCVPRFDVRVPISRFEVATHLDESIGVCIGLAADSTLSSGVVSDNNVGLLVGELRRAVVGRDVIFEHNRSGSFHVLDTAAE